MSLHAAAPARPGQSLSEVDTPALLLDLDAFERNLDRLDRTLAAHKVRVRPHAKSHKCPEIALRQMAHGAVGVCCQKVSEAEAMVEGGVMNVMVSNEVVGAQKLARLAGLARRARVSVCVDDRQNVADLDAAARAAGVKLDVLVEVNVGANRCGVEPGAPAVALARAVAGTKNLRFAGLHAYQGAAQHARSPAERQAAIARAVEGVRTTTELLAQDGLKADVITGAGTGTYLLEAGSGVYNEIQPGSYVFMDADYNRNLDEAGKPLQVFEQSLFVWATVMSHAVAGRAVVDAGLKALSVDSGMPLVADLPGVEYLKASDEHGVLALAPGSRIAVGDKVRLIPGHCDPTVNLYDWIVGVRGGKVECVWP
ncbi:MAG TPA: DSD1 family PLP-dependent enzyme, partial [Burkholderiales bacterium]|nr:DSD1 family PLP-dependent enzyme [Burkholderiales bacterium]